MTGGFSLPKPELDIEATVECAMAVINRRRLSLESAVVTKGAAHADARLGHLMVIETGRVTERAADGGDAPPIGLEPITLRLPHRT